MRNNCRIGSYTSDLLASNGVEWGKRDEVKQSQSVWNEWWYLIWLQSVNADTRKPQRAAYPVRTNGWRPRLMKIDFIQLHRSTSDFPAGGDFCTKFLLLSIPGDLWTSKIWSPVCDTEEARALSSKFQRWRRRCQRFFSSPAAVARRIWCPVSRPRSPPLHHHHHHHHRLPP